MLIVGGIYLELCEVERECELWLQFVRSSGRLWMDSSPVMPDLPKEKRDGKYISGYQSYRQA